MRISLLLTVIFLWCSQSLSAQVNIFMKITDHNGRAIEGESVSADFPKSIEVEASADAVENCITGVCKPSVKEFTVQYQLDKSLVALRKELFIGAPLQRVELLYKKGSTFESKTPFYRLVMETVFVTSIREAPARDDDPILIEVTFAPGRIGWGYRAQKKDGTFDAEMKSGWDFTKNTEWTSF